MKTNFSDLETLNFDCLSIGASPVAFRRTTTFSTGGAGEVAICHLPLLSLSLSFPLSSSRSLYDVRFLREKEEERKKKKKKKKKKERRQDGAPI